ncbi:putative gtp binding protein [Schistosoma mansoni]|uniref:putative gtp binding protein n=1 Tax=Schistosoma mansoni TaxID=6183 RepID=UPI00022DC7DD|nr:putative gtp binding protein [Schistosoma mansoni]|eukprot:XP_018649541.1 putative gtp binding protein [Schistosoma mansoni]
MDELSMYFSTSNETSKSKLNEKSAKSFTRPTNFRNDPQQRKSFRGHIKKNKTMDNSSDNAHNPFLSLNCAPNSRICGSYSCGSISTKMPHILPPEIEEGNIEYKRKLVDPTPNRFEQLVTQMKWRLNEGGGKAIYKLGVDDDGHVSGLRPSELISSLTTLERMAKRLNSTLHPLRECVIEPTTISSDKECRKAIEVLVRLAPTTNDGIVRMSSNLLTLLDLAGHSKYQRTTLAGIACNQPIIGILVISATIGLSSIGLDHIQLIYSLNLPMIIVLTKIDQLSNGIEQIKRIQTIYRQLVYQFKQIQNAWGDFNDDHFMPPFFPVSSVTGQGIDNLMHFLSRLSCLNQSPLPALSISSSSSSLTTDSRSPEQQQRQQSIEFNKFSNENHIQLMFSKIHEQMKIIKTYRDFNGTLFWINQVYTQIPGVSNPVIVGRVQLGQLLNNQILWLGPDQFGDFYPVQIVSLMHNRQVHDIVYAGQSASMEVYFLPKSWNSMNDKQRQNILHKNIPQNNKKNVNSLSSPSDIYQFYSPIKLRRGMILLTYPMLSTTYSSFTTPSPGLLPCTIDSSPLSSSSSFEFIWNEQLKSKHYINFTVVWTVKLKLIRRLPIVSFKLGNPPVILTPIPSIGQRVSIYAGCVCQTGVVLERIYQCKHEEEIQQNNLKDYIMNNNENHLDDTTYILLRFARHPELIEIGRQFILTWNGNLKTIGYAVELIDPLKHQYNLSLNTPSINSNTTTTTTDDVQDPNDYSKTNTSIINPISWINPKQNSLSFQEKDDYDWSILRMSFINRTITMNSSYHCNNEAMLISQLAQLTIIIMVVLSILPVNVSNHLNTIHNKHCHCHYHHYP